MSHNGTFSELEKILEHKYREDSRGKRSNGIFCYAWFTPDAFHNVQKVNLTR